MDKVIEIKNLTKLYKNGRGITDVNLEVERGSIFGFLGPNGAGKTTAMKIMTGLLGPDSGTVRLFGHDIRENFEQAMKHVGAIIETVECYSYLTAYENLKQQARYYEDVDNKRIDEVLALCDMLQFRDERVKNFSLGMKQRVGIAAAILAHPRLVILDEPLNGLDVEGMIAMRKLFKRLVEESNTTVFISSHLIHDVELTCTQIGIILGGKLRSVADMETILKQHRSLEDFFVSEVEKHAVV